MRIIKHTCKKCGSEEELTTGDMIKKNLIMALCTLGLIFIFQMILVGPLEIMSGISGAMLTRQAVEHAHEFRNIALNHTTYDGMDSFKFAEDLATNFPRIRYVLNSKYQWGPPDINETLIYGGDCKQASTLFVTMMRSVGYEAKVDCDLGEYNHCVARIPHESAYGVKDQYMIVDLTIDVFAIYNNSIDHWKNMQSFEEQTIILKNPEIWGNI